MKVEAIYPPLLRFLGHLALATYGIVAISYLLELTVGLVIVSKDHRFLDYFVVGPTFALPAILGLLAEHRFGRRLPALASRLLWVPPLMLLVSEMSLYYRYPWPGEDLRAELWNNFVGISCGGSECLGEALCTAPFVAAVAYGLGAELGGLKARKSRTIDAADEIESGAGR
jgi:hypothetical protein